MQTDAMEELQAHTVEENIVVNSPVNLSLMEYSSIGIIFKHGLLRGYLFRTIEEPTGILWKYR